MCTHLRFFLPKPIANYADSNFQLSYVLSYLMLINYLLSDTYIIYYCKFRLKSEETMESYNLHFVIKSDSASQ